jgi:hypothetical protein
MADIPPEEDFRLSPRISTAIFGKSSPASNTVIRGISIDFAPERLEKAIADPVG